MAIEQTIGILTFSLLLGAALTSLFHVLKRLKEGKKVANDFTIVLSIFIVGWLSTEMMTALSGGAYKQIADFAHLFILVAFAVVLTTRWRWAMREAIESSG
jgi:SNF family Na+-dependent transporter